jgi:hypothetical protein
MKKLALLFATTLVLSSCHKDTPEPVPQDNVQTPSSPQSILSLREDSLSGYWRLAIKEVYINGVYQTSTYYTATSPYFMTLDTVDVTPQNSNWKKAIDGISTTPTISQWYCNTAGLHLGTTDYTISAISSGTLIIQKGSMTTGTATAYTFGRN